MTDSKLSKREWWKRMNDDAGLSDMDYYEWLSDMNCNPMGEEMMGQSHD